MSMKSVLRFGVPVLLMATLAACSPKEEPAAAAEPAAARPADVPGWINQDDKWAETKASLQAFGEQFADSQALYDKLKAAASGGKSPNWQQMSEPAYDWSGVYTRTKGGLHFDPDLRGPEVETAQLTPAGAAVLAKKVDQLSRTGGEYDPISDCRPPGTPRWFTEPFLKEYIVTPQQTWLINEMVNDVRRVYTDGRDHTPDEDAYPTWNGDSIGFWDGDTLVMHTKHLFGGQYQRGPQPDYSDQVTLVERWHKVDPKTLQVDVWVFDPVNLAKPWYTRQSYTQLTNDDHLLRLRYWDCRENSNNDIITTDDGTSQFPDFNFVPDDAKASSDTAVKKAQQNKAAAPK